MELQFQQDLLRGKQLVKCEVRNLEETQELRLPDGMPDIGRVLGAWGQVLLRGKQWQSGNIQVSGGVQVWILYIADDGEVCHTQTWLPFQAKWDLPDMGKDGMICAEALLHNVDARNTSARKLMVRANVSVLGQMWIDQDFAMYTPGQLPSDIQLLECTDCVQLPSKVGEKAFSLDEELTLPAAAPQIEEIVCYRLQPELLDKKIMSDKVVFRGTALLHMLYMGADGQLHNWDHEMPFSQYAELEQEFSQDASAQITMAVTSLELEMQPEGRLRVKIGMTGQYIISDRVELHTVKDAFSPYRKVDPILQELVLPAIMDSQQYSVSAEKMLPVTGSVVDLSFLPDHPDRRGDLDLSGQFHLLYRDDNGQLQTAQGRWEDRLQMQYPVDAVIASASRPSGKVQAAFDGSAMLTQADMIVDTIVFPGHSTIFVKALEVAEETVPDPERPSLILTRAGKQSLWNLAKQYGSSVDSIMQTNDLDADPIPGTMLLIPVL